MKKIILLAVLLLPAVPSLVAGIESQSETTDIRREKLLNECFHRWCDAEGHNLEAMSENDGETLWVDVWMNTDDYQEAVDSVDGVLRSEKLSHIFS